MGIARPFIRAARLNQEEHDRYEEARKKTGMTHDQYIRDAINAQTERILTPEQEQS